MPRRSPFKHHRFPRDIILCAVRWDLRYPLSYQDIVDLKAERGIKVDRSTVYRKSRKNPASGGPKLGSSALTGKLQLQTIQFSGAEHHPDRSSRP